MNPEFFILHKDLPREGPGEAEDVKWALDLAKTPSNAVVLDAACGPGADSLTLAQALPEARILGVDWVGHFVDEARRRCADFADRAMFRQGDFFDETGPFDLIWCAGAFYFQGVEESLRRLRPALADDAKIAFSDAVWLKPDAPKVLCEFWSEYAGMTNVTGTVDRIAKAGYEILGQRTLSGNAWDAYYLPLSNRIRELRKDNCSNELALVLEEADAEHAMRRQFGEFYGYELFVVSP